MSNKVQGTRSILTNLDIFEVWLTKAKSDREKSIKEFIMKNMHILDDEQFENLKLKKKITMFCINVNKKWRKSGRSSLKFKKRFHAWLKLEFYSFDNILTSNVSEGTIGRGRPNTTYELSSDRTKKRRLKRLAQEKTPEELKLATEMSLRQKGKRKIADQIKNVSMSPKEDTRVQVGPKISPETALALYLDLGISDNKYITLRKVINSAVTGLLPSIYDLRLAKKTCFPKDDAIKITETSAEVQLQELLDHTCERILKNPKEMLVNESESLDLVLTSKWGFDGSSNHSVYHQKFKDPDKTDEYMFSASLVPLQLIDKLTKQILWKNPTPSSTKFCRPLKLIYEKETKELVQKVRNDINTQLNNLSATQVVISGINFSITHELEFTMVDGKICNILSENSAAQVCYICGSKPSEMNKDCSKRNVKQNTLSFGISSLHAWIRTFECMLSISYKLDLKIYQARGKENQRLVEERKALIKDKFKKECGLIINKVIPGYGTSNTGNTARRFFKNPLLSASITGLDLNLIKRFGVILRAMSSGYTIDVEKFQKYLNETKTLYLQLYSWYPMPVTVHKILVHGIDIINFFSLPIGQYSEEASEARNKEIRRFRLHNTRKTSRLNTNTDLLKILLVTSDPYISAQRQSKKNVEKLDDDVMQLLILSPDPNI